MSTGATRRPPRSRRIIPTGGATVAVVGRPNVGKSTLVNRLTGRRTAIVEERPGVTRDRTSHPAEWRGRHFTIVDTGGWTPTRRTEVGEVPLDALVSAQAEAATEAADLVVLLVDVTVGVTEEDARIAAWLRDAGVPVLLAANKVDDLVGSVAAELADLYSLGVGEPQPVSALHGRGSGDLLDVIVDALRNTGAFERGAEAAGDDIPGVALIGRPNVGKSSLFNHLLGEERTIVDPRPGTTRDSVDTVVEVAGRTPEAEPRRYRFVDTAGLRRRKAAVDATEYYSTVRTRQALDRAAVALLVVDAGEEIAEQEQRLAREILDAGRALILVLNKWDLVDEDRRYWLERERDRMLRFIPFATVVRTSARTGRGLDRLFPAIDAALAEWGKRVPTSALNRWLADAVAATPPAAGTRGQPVRIRYATQVATGPPTFRVFTTAELEPGYVRYLERRLREAFGFEGTPLRIGVRVRTRWEEREGVTPTRSRTPRRRSR